MVADLRLGGRSCARRGGERRDSSAAAIRVCDRQSYRAELTLAQPRGKPHECPRERLLEWRAPVLTDYHVHLRPDDRDAIAERYFTAANADRYRTVAAERGIAELGVAEHVYRFTAALDVWQHDLWRALRPRRPRRVLRVRARGDRPAARHRGGLHPRARGPDGEPPRAARVGLRRRLGPLPRRPRRRLRPLRRVDHAASSAGQGLAALLRRPRRGGAAAGCSTSSPTPTS